MSLADDSYISSLPGYSANIFPHLNRIKSSQNSSVFDMLLSGIAAVLAIGLCVSARSIERGQDTHLTNYEQKLSYFTNFLEAFTYPNDTIQTNMINSTLFSEDVQGRVDLTNTFDGRELNTEVLSHLTCC